MDSALPKVELHEAASSDASSALDLHYPTLLTRWDSFIQEARHCKWRESDRPIRWVANLQAPPKFPNEGVCAALQNCVGAFFTGGKLGSIYNRGQSVQETKTEQAAKRQKVADVALPALVLRSEEDLIGVIEGDKNRTKCIFPFLP